MKRSTRTPDGFTLVEVVVGIGILSIMLLAVVALVGSQRAFVEDQVVSRLRLTAQHALERVVATTSQAVTADGDLTPLVPITGVDSRGFRFRLIESIDPGTGLATYDDTLKVYIYGSVSGANPCRGLVIGRGPSLAQVHSAGCGADKVLGTEDDDTRASFGDQIPAVELLVPETFTPRTAPLFAVDVDPASGGRFVTFTLRLNARSPNNDWVLENDLVVTERVALKQ